MEVMNHSNHHDHYNSPLRASRSSPTSPPATKSVKRRHRRIAPTLIRCPYGEYDDHVISAIRSMGMEPIQWDVDSLDWKDYDAQTIYKRVTEHGAAGEHRAVPQCRAAHTGGPALHPRQSYEPERLHRGAYRPADPRCDPTPSTTPGGNSRRSMRGKRKRPVCRG